MSMPDECIEDIEDGAGDKDEKDALASVFALLSVHVAVDGVMVRAALASPSDDGSNVSPRVITLLFLVTLLYFVQMYPHIPQSVAQIHQYYPLQCPISPIQVVQELRD